MEPVKSKEVDGRATMEIVAKYNPRYGEQQADNNNKKLLMIFERDRSEIDEYLEAVDCIIHKFEHTSLEAETVRKQLLDEFGSMLTHGIIPTGISHSNYCDSISANYSTSVSTSSLSFGGDRLGPLLADLCSIAQRLSALGYVEDCKEIYKTKRLAFFNATLRRFDIEKLSVVEVKRMDWETLDKIVELWLKVTVFCVDLIPNERQTYQSIFELDRQDAPFVEIIVAYVKPFLDFARAIASSDQYSPKRLFRMLDLHRRLALILQSVLLELPKDDDPLVTEVGQVLFQVKEAARATFMNFERALTCDVSQITEVQGGVHTLTSYVMSYAVRLITEYSDECKWMVSKPRKVQVTTRINGNISEKNTIDGSGQSPFASHVTWIIASLLCSLKSKTNQHQVDETFGHFFMMNNIYCIVRNLNEHPRLRETIGSDFECHVETALHSRKLNYLRSSWSKILQDLEQCPSPNKKIKLLGMSFSAPCRMKETLRNFNATFEKVVQTQSRWLACDEDLVQGLRKYILNKLVPAYEHFLVQLPESSSSNATATIQYTVDDVKKAISQLFKGRPPTSIQS